MYTVMLVEVVFIERVANKTSTNILIYILLSILLRLTGKRDRLIGCIEKESILGKDISTCLPVSLNNHQVHPYHPIQPVPVPLPNNLVY